MELYLGLFVTALVLYITWLFYKDDYNDFLCRSRSCAAPILN